MMKKEFEKYQVNLAFLSPSILRVMTDGVAGSLKTLVLEDMRDEEGNAITTAPHPQMIFTCKAAEKIPEAAILRRRIN